MKTEIVEREDVGGELPVKGPHHVGHLQDASRSQRSTRLDDEGSGSGKGSNSPETFNQEENGIRSLLKNGRKGVTDSGAPFPEPDSCRTEIIREELKFNDANKEAATARSRALQRAVSQGVRHAQFHHHQQQQLQPQPVSAVRWERFLPQHHLRVLLVEDDDSTRQVVSALLRNCSYEVVSAANGLEAWELLMDPSNKVDLVLTEVVMPILSGIGLLTRVMSQAPLKHIPVIMMSSHDSMGIVFKCLSKGAVDFLVKPVRKNELKNLWQHIWRRCHSSSGSGTASGSGSRSGSQTHILDQPAGVADANNSGSNDESDSTSSELNIGGGSDNGSGTQSSWTKKAVEVESTHRGSHGVLQCVAEADNKKIKDADSSEGVAGLFHVQDETRPSGSTHGLAEKTPVDMMEDVDAGLCEENAQRALNLIGDAPTKEGKNVEEQQAGSEDADDLLEKHASNSPSSKDNVIRDSGSLPFLKLSLKRPCEVENDWDHECRGGLKHSSSSAFSRYNNSGNHLPLSAGSILPKLHTTPVGFGDRGFMQGSSVASNHLSSVPCNSEVDRAPIFKSGSEEMTVPPFYVGNVHTKNNQNITHPHPYPSGKQILAACFPKEEGTDLTGGPEVQMGSSSFPSMPSTLGSCKDPTLSDRPSTLAASTSNVEVQKQLQNSQFHHHSHHHHHHHHHIQHHYHHHHHQEVPQMRPNTPQQEDSTMVEVGALAPKCGSSNMVKLPEGKTGQSGSSNGCGSNAGNGAVSSLNGSASGSNNGSNGGQSAAVEPCNIDNDTQLGTGHGMALGLGAVLAPDQCRLSRREAAISKFRQKRKERCFEKKVRYQSRKLLAEQRLRVRGQFVRQSVQ